MPHNTGRERFLYSFSGVKPDRQHMIEKEFLAPHVDGPGSAALTHFLDQAPETATTRSDWARYVMSLAVRTPAGLARVAALSDSVVRPLLSDPDDAEYLAVKQCGDPETLRDLIERDAPHVLDNVGKIFLPGLIDHEELGNYIVNMKWGVMNLSGARTLLLGDQPLILTGGLKDPNSLLALPLSPTRVFIAINDMRLIDRMLGRGIDYLAEVLNDQSVRQSTQNVYGSGPEHLGFVEARLASRQQLDKK